jgi:hypothetical protein
VDGGCFSVSSIMVAYYDETIQCTYDSWKQLVNVDHESLEMIERLILLSSQEFDLTFCGRASLTAREPVRMSSFDSCFVVGRTCSTSIYWAFGEYSCLSYHFQMVRM